MQIFLILQQVVHVVITRSRRVKFTGPSGIFSSTTLIFFGQAVLVTWNMKFELLFHYILLTVRTKNISNKNYSTIILPVVLYGCEAWSLTVREERRLKVFENRLLRRVFGPKRDEVTGEWRKLRNEELNDLYSLPNIVRVVKSRRMRWAGHVARMGERKVG
jgi:hypothetical protein